MSSIANLPLMKKQLMSKRYHLGSYVALTILVLSIENIILLQFFSTPSMIILCILSLILIFYFILGIFIRNPQSLSLNILKILFFIFIIAWIFAIGFDMYYRNAIGFTAFMDVILAFIGIYVLYQILLDGQSLVNQY